MSHKVFYLNEVKKFLTILKQTGWSNIIENISVTNLKTITNLNVITNLKTITTLKK